MAAETLGGARRAAIARESTKRLEEIRSGTRAELAENPGTIRGEIVLLVAGRVSGPEVTEEDGPALVKSLTAEGLSTAQVAKEVVRRTGLDRSKAYQLAISARKLPSEE